MFVSISSSLPIIHYLYFCENYSKDSTLVDLESHYYNPRINLEAL